VLWRRGFCDSKKKKKFLFILSVGAQPRSFPERDMLQGPNIVSDVKDKGCLKNIKRGRSKERLGRGFIPQNDLDRVLTEKVGEYKKTDR